MRSGPRCPWVVTRPSWKQGTEEVGSTWEGWGRAGWGMLSLVSPSPPASRNQWPEGCIP